MVFLSKVLEKTIEIVQSVSQNKAFTPTANLKRKFKTLHKVWKFQTNSVEIGIGYHLYLLGNKPQMCHHPKAHQIDCSIQYPWVGRDRLYSSTFCCHIGRKNSPNRLACWLSKESDETRRNFPKRYSNRSIKVRVYARIVLSKFSKSISKPDYLKKKKECK